MNKDNPGTEYYKSQSNTLRAILALKDAEIKKMKESNDIKIKRISQLEGQLEVAQNTQVDQNMLIPNDGDRQTNNVDVNVSNETIRMNNMETKTKHLEMQLKFWLQNLQVLWIY